MSWSCCQCRLRGSCSYRWTGELRGYKQVVISFRLRTGHSLGSDVVMKHRNQRNVLFGGGDRGANEGGRGVCVWGGALLAVSIMYTVGSSNSVMVKHIKPIKGVVCLHVFCPATVVDCGSRMKGTVGFGVYCQATMVDCLLALMFTVKLPWLTVAVKLKGLLALMFTVKLLWLTVAVKWMAFMLWSKPPSHFRLCRHTVMMWNHDTILKAFTLSVV